MPTYHKGRVPMSPEMRAKFHREAYRRHEHRVKALPPATEPAYSTATDPRFYLLPTDDQGQCGDCFGVSTLDVASCALAAAGVLPRSPDAQLSNQAGLDCGWFSGGCNGGDEAQVFEYLRTTGAPLQKDYGPYTASPGRCKTGLTLYKIADWGYCTPAQQNDVASTQDMKNCMKAYGPISIAIDAGEFDSYTGGTITGRGTNVDHAIKYIAWDDNHDNGDGSKGAWVAWNQWGSGWGITVTFTGPDGSTVSVSGCAWVKYGADSGGTEAIWCSGGTLPPPPSGAPYKLYEGSMTTPVQVGTPTGYLTLAAAESDAHVFADKDKTDVMVHDSAGTMVETISPTPPPPAPTPMSATVTIPPGGLSGTVFGFVPVSIGGGTFQVDFSPTPGQHGAIPSWVIELVLANLRILCGQVQNLPSPWNTWAGIACGLIPPGEHHRMAFAHLTVDAVPPWLLPVLRVLCTFAPMIPAPVGTAIAFACSLLPASIRGCGGCK